MFICTQIPQKFACGGLKNIGAVLKCSLECRNAPLSFAKLNQKQTGAIRDVSYGGRNAPLPFVEPKRIRAGAILDCFTGVGTRHCHSRNQIGAAHCSGTIPDILRV